MGRHNRQILKSETKKGKKMTQEEKLEALAEIFDCDVGELKPETQLDTLQWDSMAMLSLIALVKAKFDKKIAGTEISGFKTVQDVMGAMGK